MIRAALLATALALPAAGLAAPAYAQGQTFEQPSTLSLSATGEVRIAPDLAVVSAGAVTRGDTAAEALQANARLMNEVFRALNRAGIAERDRQTSNLSVNPVYAHDEPDTPRGERQGPRIVGYEARNTVTATVRDLDNLGQTIDAIVSNGANELQGIQFSAEDPSEARNEARRRAIAELNALKDLYAEAAGFDVLGLHQISESGGMRPQPQMMRAESYAMDAGTPIASGELTVSVTVNASWRIAD